MKYEKPPLTFEDQTDRLLARGMTGDRDDIRNHLERVNYYRLSGYWYPFRRQDDTFRPGTTFESVWRRYTFDRQLRLLVLDGIERVEVAARTLLAYHHAHDHGPFGYAENPESLKRLKPAERTALLENIRLELGRSHELFVRHFRQKYGDTHPDYLPIWMATEAVSFGRVVMMMKGSPTRVRERVAVAFGVPGTVLSSWLHCLSVVRNICAHHGRLWNRTLGVKPKLPRHDDWRSPVRVQPDRVFSVLTICRHSLQQIAPASRWHVRLDQLLTDYPEVPVGQLGFPSNWRDCPIWTR